MIIRSDLTAGSSNPVAPFCDVSGNISPEVRFHEVSCLTKITFSTIATIVENTHNVASNCMYLIPDPR